MTERHFIIVDVFMQKKVKTISQFQITTAPLNLIEIMLMHYTIVV